jgi:hypothetical protein
MLREHDNMLLGSVGVVVAILAAIAAHKAATRKHRTPLWAFFCFWFSPLLLILMVLGDARPRSANLAPPGGEEKTQACDACGGTVSTEAKACPHCGHPQHLELALVRTRPHALEYLGYLAVVGVIALAVITNIPDTSPLYASGLPGCDSDRGKESVNKAMADAPFG